MEAGLPPGVVNIVTGYGHVAGAALAGASECRQNCFYRINCNRACCPRRRKGQSEKVSLELGGKSPVIILDDADLDHAIPGAANAIYFNGGQVCVAGSRVYAHRSVFERVVDGISAAANDMKLGNGLNPETQMGPLVSAKQAQAVAGFVDRARGKRRQCCHGGRMSWRKRLFYAPSVITDVFTGNGNVRKRFLVLLWFVRRLMTSMR